LYSPSLVGAGRAGDTVLGKTMILKDLHGESSTTGLLNIEAVSFEQDFFASRAGSYKSKRD
jgi:hypothetical protein